MELWESFKSSVSSAFKWFVGLAGKWQAWTIVVCVALICWFAWT